MPSGRVSPEGGLPPQRLEGAAFGHSRLAKFLPKGPERQPGLPSWRGPPWRSWGSDSGKCSDLKCAENKCPNTHKRYQLAVKVVPTMRKRAMQGWCATQGRVPSALVPDQYQQQPLTMTQAYPFQFLSTSCRRSSRRRWTAGERGGRRSRGNTSRERRRSCPPPGRTSSSRRGRVSRRPESCFCRGFREPFSRAQVSQPQLA